MKKLIFIVCLLMTTKGITHPTSFEGSKGIMGYHSPVMNHGQINYSYRYWFAVGAHHFNIPTNGQNRFANFLSTNFLLKRWNGPSYQGNLYAVLGLGHSQFSKESLGAGLSKIQFDIEDRDYYFLTSYSRIDTEEQRHFQDMMARIGLSPYVGKFDDIHTWLILEYRAQEVLDEGIFEDLTPFLRIFYKNLLFEIGQSFKGNTRFNYIIHF